MKLNTCCLWSKSNNQLLIISFWDWVKINKHSKPSLILSLMSSTKFKWLKFICLKNFRFLHNSIKWICLTTSFKLKYTFNLQKWNLCNWNWLSFRSKQDNLQGTLFLLKNKKTRGSQLFSWRTILLVLPNKSYKLMELLIIGKQTLRYSQQSHFRFYSGLCLVT